MSLSSRLLNDAITHWPAPTSDGYGGFTFGTPVLLAGRWEEKQELFRDAAGRETVSQAHVFVSGDVAEGDYLACGDFRTTANPTTGGAGSNGIGAHPIRSYSRSTNLRNTDSVRKAIL